MKIWIDLDGATWGADPTTLSIIEIDESLLDTLYELTDSEIREVGELGNARLLELHNELEEVA